MCGGTKNNVPPPSKLPARFPTRYSFSYSSSFSPSYVPHILPPPPPFIFSPRKIVLSPATRPSPLPPITVSGFLRLLFFFCLSGDSKITIGYFHVERVKNSWRGVLVRPGDRHQVASRRQTPDSPGLGANSPHCACFFIQTSHEPFLCTPFHVRDSSPPVPDVSCAKP